MSSSSSSENRIQYPHYVQAQDLDAWIGLHGETKETDKPLSQAINRLGLAYGPITSLGEQRQQTHDKVNPQRLRGDYSGNHSIKR